MELPHARITGRLLVGNRIMSCGKPFVVAGLLSEILRLRYFEISPFLIFFPFFSPLVDVHSSLLLPCLVYLQNPAQLDLADSQPIQGLKVRAVNPAIELVVQLAVLLRKATATRLGVARTCGYGRKVTCTRALHPCSNLE